MVYQPDVKRRFLWSLIGGCGVLLTPVFSGGGQTNPPRPPPVLTYNIIDLGTLGGSSSVALGINDQGQVVGSADTPQGLRHAYRWQNGVMTDLGTLGFPTAQSEAKGINNNGVVVGNVGTGDPNKAFIWENGVQTEIGPPQVLKSAYGVNGSKQVVGQFVIPAGGGDKHAFLWQNGTLTDLGTLGGPYSIAWDINPNGQVVGKATTTSTERPFLWHNGVMVDLGTLGGSAGAAYGINDMGQVVGSAATPEKALSAFVWNEGVMTDLGALGGFNSSSAEAINNDGVVVGLASGGSFICDPRLGMGLLQDMIPQQSGWSGLRPLDINNSGWIVGYGTNPSGFAHAFLMTPATVIPAVSEYGAGVILLLLLICGTLLLRGRSTTG